MSMSILDEGVGWKHNKKNQKISEKFENSEINIF
jgi:hypothetical protein